MSFLFIWSKSKENFYSLNRLKINNILLYSFRYVIPSVSSVMPILLIQKLVNSKKRESLEVKLSKFINSLDNFESAIKKNKTFLHEAQIIKSSSNILKRYDKENKIPNNLVLSIKTVINALYDFVKDLETYSVDEKLSLIYEPFEDLQDCELMTMQLEGVIDLKIIKVSFIIFFILDKIQQKKQR